MIMIANQDASVDIAQDSITGRDVKEHGAERTRHFCLEDDSPVYVIGHLGRHKGERRIGKASGIPFIISNHTEADLLFKHGWGFGLVAVVILAASILLGLAHSNWMETWEGRVVRKYTYRTKSKDSTTTHYAIDFDTGAKRELRRSEWNSVRAGNYIVKNSHRYTIEIRR